MQKGYRQKHNLLSLLNNSLIIKILIILVAYSYIYFRISNTLLSTHNYSLIGPWSHNKLVIIFIIILLMIFNWLIESLKWNKLIAVIDKISYTNSIKSVLIGITCSVFTPYRLGEYAGRPMILDISKRPKAVMANVMSSISQNIVTYNMGIIGITLLILQHQYNVLSATATLFIFCSLFFISIILLICFFWPEKPLSLILRIKKMEKWKKNLLFLTKYKKSKLLLVLAMSLSRYTIFFTQYYLLILFFGIDITVMRAFTAISISYVFLFSIPGIPAAELGFRGSIALFFIGMYSSKDLAIISASSALWIINLAIPALFGTFFLMRLRKQPIKS